MSAQARKKHEAGEDAKDFLTVIIGNQRFGIPILQVQDVLGEQKVTRIPLAPPEISGSLNLRGRIVTSIDVKKRLNFQQDPDGSMVPGRKSMSVVVEYKDELYSLVIDSVGDVMRLKDNLFESNPPTLDQGWREISAGIFRLEGELLVVLDVPRLIESVHV